MGSQSPGKGKCGGPPAGYGALALSEEEACDERIPSPLSVDGVSNSSSCVGVAIEDPPAPRVISRGRSSQKRSTAGKNCLAFLFGPACLGLLAASAALVAHFRSPTRGSAARVSRTQPPVINTSINDGGGSKPGNLRLSATASEAVEDGSQDHMLHFPLSFEADAPGRCPAGWVCMGKAVNVCDKDQEKQPVNAACDHPGLAGQDGERYLSVGDDIGTGEADSAVFLLPDNISSIRFRRSGGSDNESGFYVKLYRSGEVACASEDGQDTNVLFNCSCDGLANYSGQAVFISIRDRQSTNWGKVLVDDIRLTSFSGEDILAAERLPVLLVTTTTTTTPWQWIEPPVVYGMNSLPSVITYAGKDKQAYVDGAVILGLSLSEYLPANPRYCMVDSTMPDTFKQQLAKVGWHLIELQEWHPTLDRFANGYWWDVYNKINVFRIRVNKLLYLDADMLVLSDKLQELLSTNLSSGEIAMVEDMQHGQFNAGLMLLAPNISTFVEIRGDMTASQGWDGLDQPVINKHFEGRVVHLDRRFNAHGSSNLCDSAVVAHYTGHNKPSLASVANLKQVHDGFRERGPPYLQCPELYERYFCRMQVSAEFLSDPLQKAIGETGPKQGCPEFVAV
mmetsp:Transcript_81276/g.161294  ORF Transcript_81276/g.161294 Transcript_81276/m.161294 type:complete len:621 (-) Transcript_81276:10-1872(-)